MELGFKKRWGRDEGWVVYGFEGGSAFSFSVFLVCWSELCGLDWEMNWWEGGSNWEILGIGLRNELCGSDWEMEKGNSLCVERIGYVRERILSVWHEGDGGARCDWAWRALAASSACERAQTEIVWSENENGNCFTPWVPYFTVNTENIFSLTQFFGPTKQPILRKNISEISLKPKQTQP